MAENFPQVGIRQFAPPFASLAVGGQAIFHTYDITLVNTEDDI